MPTTPPANPDQVLEGIVHTAVEAGRESYEIENVRHQPASISTSYMHAAAQRAGVLIDQDKAGELADRAAQQLNDDGVPARRTY